MLRLCGTIISVLCVWHCLNFCICILFFQPVFFGLGILPCPVCTSTDSCLYFWILSLYLCLASCFKKKKRRRRLNRNCMHVSLIMCMTPTLGSNRIVMLCYLHKSKRKVNISHDPAKWRDHLNSVIRYIQCIPNIYSPKFRVFIDRSTEWDFLSHFNTAVWFYLTGKIHYKPHFAFVMKRTVYIHLML